MNIFLLILIIIVSILVGLFILIQHPKGGGIGSLGGFSSSFSSKFGVQQAGNILEKGTYITIIVLVILSIVSVKISTPDAIKPSIDINNVIKSPAPTPPIENALPSPEDASSSPSPLPSQSQPEKNKEQEKK